MHASRLAFLFVFFFGSNAYAQEIEKPPAPTETSDDASPPPVVPPPPPVPPPAPPPPSTLEKAAAAITSIVRPYGIIKPTIITSVGGLESFGNPNAAAETAAGNPVLATAPKDTRLTFQAAQSRVGVYIAEKSVARGQLELDFIDFTKSSPTVQAVPRLRIAKVEYEPKEGLVFCLGQDWDIWGPMMPFGTNLVGASFNAGNVGFMRQQVKAIYTNPAKTYELAAAVGLQSANPSGKDANPELARVPTFAVRGAALFGKSRIGVSGIATELRQSAGNPDERRTGSYGALAYWDISAGERFQIKGEGYIGRNLNNIGSLALGFGTRDVDIDEIGGYASGRFQIAEEHAVYVTFGVAQILNPSDVRPSYSITPGATPAAAATRALSGTGPGMKFNMHARVGYEYRPVKSLAFMAEPFLYRSRHVFQAADFGRFDPMRVAPGFEAGAMYFF